MNLQTLFSALADVFDGPKAIEKHARAALISATPGSKNDYKAIALSKPFLDVMAEIDAHPVCRIIAQTTLQWVPPQTLKFVQ